MDDDAVNAGLDERIVVDERLDPSTAQLNQIAQHFAMAAASPEQEI